MCVDEVHRTGTEVFSRAFMKFAPAYTIGLSATVQRKDGLSKVFMWYLGDVVYSRKRAQEDVRVEMVHYAHASPAYGEELYIGRSDKVNTSAMINRICDFEPRTRLVAERIAAAAGEGRRTLVLCDRKAFLRALHAMLEGLGIDSGFYFGGLPQSTLDASAQKGVVLCTFAFASEGLDIPSLNCLFLCSPKTDIEQSVGRILRTEKHKRTQVPLIVDIVDHYSVFPAQGAKRKRFYKRYNYDIVQRYVGVEAPTRRSRVAAAEPDFSRCLIDD
jgi:superfamily II DNA or RNA helicase